MPETSVRPERVGTYAPPAPPTDGRQTIAQRAFASVLDAGFKTATIISTAGLLFGAGLGVMGMRIFGPRDEIAAVEKRLIQRDSARLAAIQRDSARTTNVEAAVAEIKTDISDIKSDSRVLRLLSCAQMRGQSSPLVLEACSPPSPRRSR